MLAFTDEKTEYRILSMFLSHTVGAPIEVKRIGQPTIEDIDKLHQRFCDELNTLFETHKSKYIENADSIKLVIQ